MKILTWNINGIRAVKDPLPQILAQLDADIICFQETKVTRDQLDEPSAIVEGYNSYFSFSKSRSGYSGVATFVKDSATPTKAEEGLSGRLVTPQYVDTQIGCYGDQTDFSEEEVAALDNEGRTIITQHKMMDDDGGTHTLTVINVYCPRADPEREDRKLFKLQFYRLLQARAEAIVAAGSHVIVLGDVNASHERIDTVRAEEGEDFDNHPGRQWLNQLLWTKPAGDHPQPAHTHSPQNGQFVDTFRYFHPTQENAFTCWSTMTGARATNYGTRIDYILADTKLAFTSFTDCIIQPHVEGSDHCPVLATLSWHNLPAKNSPALCTKYMPEFAGRQQKLSSYFTKSSATKSCKDGANSQASQAGTAHEMEPVSTGNSCTKQQSSKRSLSGPSERESKKQKLSKKGSSVASKQSSLLSFLAKPSNKPSPAKSSSSPSKDSAARNSESSETCEKSATGAFSTNSPLKGKTLSNSWRTLLKGPPSAPLCRGHQEECVLRTVKKDSLNRGRQFWVCQKPEGHKTNPEARCDHFEWIPKEKKPK